MMYMNKNSVVAFCIFLFGSFSYAQMGINTMNPLGLFHVDGLGNNANNTSLTPTQQLDDFILLRNRRVGIGTTIPFVKFEISSNELGKGLKLVDGTEGEGKILYSGIDSLGYANWSKKTIYAVLGSMNGGMNIPLSTDKFDYNSTNSNKGLFPTGSYIELPPGKWLITLDTQFKISLEPNQNQSVLNYGSWFTIQFSFSDTNNLALNSITNDIEDLNNQTIWNLIDGPTNTAYSIGKYASVFGQLVIYNQTKTNKKYYLIAGGVSKSEGLLEGVIFDVGGNTHGNFMTALPILTD